jgi:hypothetical protein
MKCKIISCYGEGKENKAGRRRTNWRSLRRRKKVEKKGRNSRSNDEIVSSK